MSQTLILLALSAWSGSSAATTAAGGNHLVFPITTELQRKLVQPWTSGDAKHAKAYVLINGTGVVADNGKVDDNALDLDALRKALAPYAEPKDGVVVLNMVYRLKGSAELVATIKAFGKDAGFRDAKVINTYMGQDFDWEKHIARINEKVGGADRDETPTGSDIVRVYPIQTILSRYLTSNADCVVDVLQPVENETDSIEARIREAVLTEVPKAEIKNKGRILFRVSSKPSARKVIDQFAEQGSKELAQMLGYEEASVQSGSR